VKEPRWDIKRGRHKKNASAETRDWNRKHLPPKIPCPPWMDAETHLRLLELRKLIDPWENPQ